MESVLGGQTQSIVVQRNHTGKGSAGDELRLLDFPSRNISALLKLTSSGGDCSSARTGLQGGAILARIFSIF